MPEPGDDLPRRPRPPIGFIIPELIYNLTFYAAKLSEAAADLAGATGVKPWREDDGELDVYPMTDAPTTIGALRGLIEHAEEELRLVETAGGDGDDEDNGSGDGT